MRLSKLKLHKKDLGGSVNTPPLIVGRRTATELWVGAGEQG